MNDNMSTQKSGLADSPGSAVLDFAADMQHKLDKNARKPCPHMLADGEVRTWEHCDLGWLITRIEDEVAELKDELSKGNFAEARLECADVGNFAMMIHDNLGRILSLAVRPRKQATGILALQKSLGEMVRIVDAMRYTAGLGKNQAERLERAKSLLPNSVMKEPGSD